ncbi:MAG: cell division cycle 123 family protein [Flavobacteriales bacterium]|nr:cell division cycle 123 family protein [Flavobacteriales bacterium]
MEKRFTNDVHLSELIDIDQFFSKEEQRLILQFAEAMNVDFAEFDVLRDNQSGKIYIIDVNTTPYGPPAELSKQDHQLAVARLSAAMKRWIEGQVM